MINLQTLANNATKKLRNADFSKLNSDSTVLITSDVAIISGQLARVYDIKRLDKEILAKEANANDTKALSEAELINKYDITYRQILRKNIASTITAIQNAIKSNSDRQFKTALQTTITNLNNLDKRLSELNLQ
jgi:hypothetical protein